MKNLSLAFVLALLFVGCAPQSAERMADRAGEMAEALAPEAPIVAALDLTAVSNDRVPVTVDPGAFTTDEVLYRIPRVVQGTYAISDFGRYVDDFRAYDYAGNVMTVERDDLDTWRIADAQRLDRISYYVNDTFDIEQTDTPTPFSPSGTNIAPEVYVLNLHGFVGYFEGMNDLDYEVRVTMPAEAESSAALDLARSEADGGAVTNVYEADRYFEVTDNPMMVGDLDIAEFTAGGMDVSLALYSPTGKHTAAALQPTLERMMSAQIAYLGDLETTDSYNIFLYLADEGDDQPTGSGALEHHKSTVMTGAESQEPAALAGMVVDVISHEFFHIVQPLTVHSEDIHNFDYHAPTFSKHLWFYEGQTEYFASHFQVYEGLEPRAAFYQKMGSKIDGAAGFDPSISFTEMSENVADEPYAGNYLNVYQGGALIGMCNDIMVRAASDGERSLIDVMEELQDKYGEERPFDDDTFIDEFEAFTTPEVGAFLRAHVVGTEPVDYNDCLAPVGLTVREMEGRSTLFAMAASAEAVRLYITTASTHDPSLVFPHGPLNSTLENLGVQGGDRLVSFNGSAYTLTNLAELIQMSIPFSQNPEAEITLVVERDGEEIELSGPMGTATGFITFIEELPNATPEQIELRNAWLGEPVP